ncbi:ABC transporter permease [Roseiconus lacunae]|uniref:ABC transporter permease n=1 Tax=Roseiconus lacunae TaxID=2605694 RepID=A0ABT7PCJ3_9BACT|nr:ABC transporter permease [Roseiconus lacunae]MCD0458966.1 ABC transporter permease [Roseiconus lacunae]MDM4014218.1 ABC transporter permease [Roseiconus lacunae]WRQ53512.1 ABC transporter permease [Stieleria sp. HD01]
MNWRGNALKFCNVAGLPIVEPFIRLAAGEDVKEQFKSISKFILLPIAAIATFLFLWNAAAKTVVTDSMKLPSPSETWSAGTELFAMHQAQRAADKEQKQEKITEAIQLIAKANYLTAQAESADGERQEKLLANALVLKKKAVQAANYRPSSAPTFVDQIFTSLKTVFVGFVIATLIAVPIGVLCGMNPWCNAALTPFIQVFKPVSPLAWLPLAFLIIVWAYSGTKPGETFFEKAFLISAVTVSLCSLWPTLVNTTLGVASVDKDYMNVARVLKLSWSQQLFKIILPASLPLMFAGLRISLGVGWMVLIAADMLAQNPGLGKFVWDEFQNGSSQTYARIAFSVIIIGVIGLLLDRVMIFLRNLVSFGNPQAA